MTASATPQLTVAETALVDGFVQRMGDLPGNADTVHARDNALTLLKKNGLPTRKVEAWHYTDLRRLLKTVPSHIDSAQAQSVAPILDGSDVLAVVNGQLDAKTEIAGANVTVTSDALKADVGGLSLEASDIEDAVGLINTAFVTDGVQITVADDATLSKPVEFQSLHAGGQVHTRNGVVFGKGSSGMVIDRHLGDDTAVLASNVTRITVREGADVTWIRIQDQGAEATHLGQLDIDIEADGKLTLFVVNFSGKLVREEVLASIVGEGADLTFRSVNLLGDTTHCDVTLKLDHLVPNTTSTETVRNVINGKAQGVFQGQIKVAQVAQKTDAQMACNTLLLSDESGISVKPELEIFADDVICAHGATVAEIDPDHLFYLMARGISEKSARGLLVKAFVAEIVEELEHDRLVEVLEDRIDAWLEAHG